MKALSALVRSSQVGGDVAVRRSHSVVMPMPPQLLPEKRRVRMSTRVEGEQVKHSELASFYPIWQRSR
jgi:hypothetical protein